jgi:hypothetical protein
MRKWRFAGPGTHATYHSNDLRQLLVAGGFAADGIEVQLKRLPMGVTGLIAIARILSG